MKKTLLVFLVPFMAIANPINHSQDEFLETENNVEINFESENDDHLLPYTFEDNTAAIKRIMQTKIADASEHKSLLVLGHITASNLPKNLNTFSLVGLYDYESTATKPQKRLNSLLAADHPEFPKENTLLKNLHPVRFKSADFDGAENMPEGFGPKIRF